MELAPPKHREVFVGIVISSLSFSGVLVGLTVLWTFSFDSDWSWRAEFVVEIVFPAVAIILILFMDESPPWLIYKGRHEDALEVITRLHTQWSESTAGRSPSTRPDQLWQALQRKIHYSSEFVPVLSGCKVHSDANGVVDREVVLDFGKWGKRPMLENVTCHGDLWIVLRQSEGSTSTNLISFHPDVSDTDMMLTYIFDWDFPSIQEGTPENKELVTQMSKMAIMGVVKSCERAREMVTEGLIK